MRIEKGGNHEAYSNIFEYSLIDTSLRESEDNTFLWTYPKDSFVCRVGKETFVVTSGANFYKYRNDTLVAEFGFDLGYMYRINDLRYYLLDNTIVFVFFITESFKLYTLVASFNRKNLLNARKLYLTCCYHLKEYEIDEKFIQLLFDEKEITINVGKDLKREDKDYEKDMRKLYEHLWEE